MPLRTFGGAQAGDVDVDRVGSFQEIAVLLDVRGEIERMLAHEALGELGVALLQRLDDPHVVD
jgi:hypothetical protein